MLECKQCDRVFKQYSTLRTHLFLHEGVKPYKCKECTYACRQITCLRTHYKNKHLITLPFSEKHVLRQTIRR